jgi:hypothetical protein
MWLRAKTEGLMCLWMMLDTMIKNIVKSRERAVASNEMPRHFTPPGGMNVLASSASGDVGSGGIRWHVGRAWCRSSGTTFCLEVLFVKNKRVR